MSKLQVGIIGLGEVAQLMHLPTLGRLRDRFDDIARFDAGLDLYARRKRMRLLYDTPYIRNLPMRLEIQESTDDANAWTASGPYYKDAFEVELEALHAAITRSGENRTPPSDSLADFDIFEAIIAHLRPEQAS